MYVNGDIKENRATYIRDEVGPVTRPTAELRGFERISRKPGEARTVLCTLGRRELQFYNREMKPVVEPEKFVVMSGRTQCTYRRRR